MHKRAESMAPVNEPSVKRLKQKTQLEVPKSHKVKLSETQLRLIHSLHISSLLDREQVSTCFGMILRQEGFYQVKNHQILHSSNERVMMRERRMACTTQMPICLHPDIQNLIYDYVDVTSDQMILVAARKAWKWDFPGRANKTHWLYERAEKEGVFTIIHTFMNENPISGQDEYVELVLQFLLHHSTDGLYDILLASQKARNINLIIEAINQAWEMQHFEQDMWLCETRDNSLRTRDCTCFYCKQNYCHLGMSYCGCLDRRRKEAQMRNQPVEKSLDSEENQLENWESKYYELLAEKSRLLAQGKELLAENQLLAEKQSLGCTIEVRKRGDYCHVHRSVDQRDRQTEYDRTHKEFKKGKRQKRRTKRMKCPLTNQ